MKKLFVALVGVGIVIVAIGVTYNALQMGKSEVEGQTLEQPSSDSSLFDPNSLDEKVTKRDLDKFRRYIVPYLWAWVLGTAVLLIVLGCGCSALGDRLSQSKKKS